jgi:hypothetical protein
MGRQSLARRVSTNNLGGNATPALRQSSTGVSLATSMHASIPRRGSALQRTLTGDGLTTIGRATTRSSLRTQRDGSSSPAQSCSMITPTHHMGGGKARPNLSRNRSDKSSHTEEEVKSSSSTEGEIPTPRHKENSILPKGTQERMRQRAALRATGASSLNLRSTLSETSSCDKPFVLRRTYSAGASHRSPIILSPTGQSVSYRPTVNSRSVPVSQSTVSSRKMNRGTSLSFHERSSPISYECQHQLTDRQEPHLHEQKMQDNAGLDDKGKSMAQEEIRNEEGQLAQRKSEEKYDVHESPRLSPKKHGDDLDAQSGSKEQVSLANTINTTESNSSSDHRVTSAMLGVMLTIPSLAAQAESPVSTTSTKKIELLQRYRREQNSSARSRQLERLRDILHKPEAQHLNMVPNQQEQVHFNKQDETALDSTDVIAVIVNLRDELSAAQEVIEQQRHIMETLSSQEEERKEYEETPSCSESANCPPGMVSLRQYQELQLRFVYLQMDRAWGEFQLRDRITTDALKFHRRLRRWKDQAIELRCSLLNLENDHEQQLEAFKQKTEHRCQVAERESMEVLDAVRSAADEKFLESQKEHAEQVADLQQKADEYREQSKQAEKELQELKKATQIAFDEFCDAKDRIEMLENEISALKGGSDDENGERHRDFPKKRLTRRSCKRDVLDEDEKGEGDAAATPYWGSWFHRSSAPLETPGKDEKCFSKSNPVDEEVEKEKQLLPSRFPVEGDKTFYDEPLSVDVECTKATTRGAWGLPKLFSPDTESSRQYHEMKLTDRH